MTGGPQWQDNPVFMGWCNIRVGREFYSVGIWQYWKAYFATGVFITFVKGQRPVFRFQILNILLKSIIWGITRKIFSPVKQCMYFHLIYPLDTDASQEIYPWMAISLFQQVDTCLKWGILWLSEILWPCEIWEIPWLCETMEYNGYVKWGISYQTHNMVKALKHSVNVSFGICYR